MTDTNTPSRADRLQEILGTDVDYSQAQTSFSPFYSDLGFGFDERAGAAALYLHYNRRMTTLNDWLPLPGEPLEREQTALYVRQLLPNGTARFAFCGRNTWLIEASGLGTLGFRFNASGTIQEIRREETAQGYILYDGYLPTKDKRDPDDVFPFVLGLRVIRGSCRCDDSADSLLVLSPDEDGHLLAAFSANMLDVDHERIVQMLAAAPCSLDDAIQRSREWLDAVLGELDFEAPDPAESAVLARAALTLAFNACEAPGMLAGRVSAFPNREHYPVHYLWDTCFQNLALEHMEPRLAEDSLRLLTENLRGDGKMYHFIASTWSRPKGSQPPLVGWAGLRLVHQREYLDLAKHLLPVLMMNNQWWLTQRMTHYGIISCPEPLETGWDDTPRLDSGPILPLDMNSHLLLQMRCCVELAKRIGDYATQACALAMAKKLARRMVELLYDEQANLFKDVLVATGEKLPIKTPACFLPLLAEVPIPEDKARRMIEDYLLNPDYFFGKVPFPSVAYDEPTYDPDGFWRGPTWMPIAYLMLEVLRKYDYQAEAHQAAKRLYDIMIADGQLRELFNSRTGEGKGAFQQGWTAAILLRLKMELDSDAPA